jgi:Ca2+-binding EF-hand superfamily protein
MKQIIVGILLIAASASVAQDRVSKLDKNADGRVEYSEVVQACSVSESLVKRADKNSDGVLSNGELQQAKGYLKLRSCNRTKAV